LVRLELENPQSNTFYRLHQHHHERVYDFSRILKITSNPATARSMMKVYLGSL
jgi:hypothetical protein